MKTAIKILILILVSLNSFAQPYVIRGRGTNTQVDSFYHAVLGLQLPLFADTVNANVTIAKGYHDSLGRIIYTTDNKKLWIREANPIKWREIQSGGSGANNYPVSVVNIHDSLIINRSGLDAISTPLVHYHTVEDSNGTEGVRFTQSDGFKITGRGIDVSFDSATQRVILTNVGGGSSSVSYVNSIAYTSGDSTFTLGRVGLSNLTTIIPTSSTWYVGDSAGVQKFGVPKFQNLNLKGGVGISLSFDAANRLVTISNTGGTSTTTGANNYPTGLTFGAGVFTMTLNGLPPLSVNGIGTVQRVGFSAPSSITVSGTPITGTGTITISGAGSANQYYDGTLALRPFPTLLSQFTNDVPYLTSIAHNHVVYNSGVQQFTYGVNEGISFVAGSGMTLTYNSGAKSITFTNISGGSGANNYTTATNFNPLTGIFTTSRNGLSDLTADSIGTIQSIRLTMPSAFTVTGSPVNTLSGVFTVTGAGTTAQYIRGNGTLAGFPTLLSQFTNDPAFISTSSFNIANSAGATQFGVATGNSLRVTAGTGIDVAFVSGTKELIITNVGTATSSANNYVTAINYDSTTQIFSLARNGLTTLTTIIPAGTASGGTLSQTIIDVLNNYYFPNQTANWQATMLAGNWTTKNAEFLNNGVNAESKIDFGKTHDTASLKANEYYSNQTYFDITLGQHPDIAENILRLNMPDTFGKKSSWTPFQASGIENKLTASKTKFWTPMYVPVLTSFASVDTGRGVKGMPFTSTTAVIERTEGVGTTDLNVDATTYTDSSSRLYYVRARIDTTVATSSPMDIVFVVDTTSSMGAAIANVQANIDRLASTFATRSGGDYRLGLVTFGDNPPVVRVPFGTNNIAAFSAVVAGLQALAGNSEAESSDVAIDSALNRFSFRAGVAKLIILVTDAMPGGTDPQDKFKQSDTVYQQVLFDTARARGIRISSVYTPASYDFDFQSFYDPVTLRYLTTGAYKSTTTQRWADSTSGLFYWDRTEGNSFANAIIKIVDTFATTTTNYGDVVTAFDWGYSNGSALVTGGTGVSATGSFQTLEKGLKVKLASGFKAGDFWTFRVYPEAMPQTDTASFDFVTRNKGTTHNGQITRTSKDLFTINNSSGSPQMTVRYGQAFKLTAGSNIGIAFDNTNNNITISATGGSSGVISIGQIDGFGKFANGLVINGTQLYTQTADATYPGMVSTTSQTFAGDKTNLGTVQAPIFNVRNNTNSTTAVINFTGASNQSITIPNNSGVLTLSVNNVFANSAGNVTINTDNVGEGTTNHYFTNALARAAVSLNFTTTGTSGAATGSYSNVNGIFSINVPNYTFVSSVGITSSASALTISNTPITSSGNIGVNFNGTSSQVVLGNGSLGAYTNGTLTSVALASGTTGSDVNINGSPITSSGTITINIPSASASARGLVTATTQTFGGDKTFGGGILQKGSSVLRVEGTGGSVPSGSTGVGAEIFTSGGNAYYQSYDQTGSAFAPIILRGSSTSIVDLAGSNAIVGVGSGGLLSRISIGTGLSLSGGILSSNNGGGSVTSVGASISGALSVSGTPITSSGTLAFAWTGTSSQYVKGDGSFGNTSTIGTVQSVDLTMPSGFTVSGNPVTTSGTLAVTTSLNGIIRGTGSGFTTTTIGSDLTFSSGTLAAVNQRFGHPSGDNTMGENRNVNFLNLYNMTLTGTNTGSYLLNVNGGVGGIFASGTTGITSSGTTYGIQSLSTNNPLVANNNLTSSLSSVRNVLRLQASSGGSATSNGFGAELSMELANGSGTVNQTGAIVSKWTTVGSAASMEFSTTGANRMIINGNGQLTLNNYDATNMTGTPTYLLGTDASGNAVKKLIYSGSNLGGGTNVFAQLSASDFQFKSLVSANSNLVITSSGTEVTLNVSSTPSITNSSTIPPHPYKSFTGGVADNFCSVTTPSSGTYLIIAHATGYSTGLSAGEVLYGSLAIRVSGVQYSISQQSAPIYDTGSGAAAVDLTGTYITTLTVGDVVDIRMNFNKNAKVDSDGGSMRIIKLSN